MTRISASNGIVALDDSTHVRITRIHRVGSHEALPMLEGVANGPPAGRAVGASCASRAGPSGAAREAFGDDLRAVRPLAESKSRSPLLGVAPSSSPGADDPPPPYSPPGTSAPYLPASPPPPYSRSSQDSPGEMHEAPPIYLPPGVDGLSGET